MSLLKSINLKIAEKLKDKEYRDQFFESWTHDEIATQLRNLRNRRDLRQVDVAATTGMKQSAISRLEQAEYSRWGFPTLLRIAQGYAEILNFQAFNQTLDRIDRLDLQEINEQAKLSILTKYAYLKGESYLNSKDEKGVNDQLSILKNALPNIQDEELQKDVEDDIAYLRSRSKRYFCFCSTVYSNTESLENHYPSECF